MRLRRAFALAEGRLKGSSFGNEMLPQLEAAKLLKPLSFSILRETYCFAQESNSFLS